MPVTHKWREEVITETNQCHIKRNAKVWEKIAGIKFVVTHEDEKQCEEFYRHKW